MKNIKATYPDFDNVSEAHINDGMTVDLTLQNVLDVQRTDREDEVTLTVQARALTGNECDVLLTLFPHTQALIMKALATEALINSVSTTQKI